MARQILYNEVPYLEQRTKINENFEDLYNLVESESGGGGVVSISSLPTTGIQIDVIYKLTANDGNAPVGFYTYAGGWVCLAQQTIMSVGWGVSVSAMYYAGVSYAIAVDNTISVLSPIISAVGGCSFLLSNPDGYAISEPSTGYKRTDTGLDAISDPVVELMVSFNGAHNIYSAVALEEL